jgi:hypothetical protein
MTVFIEVTEEMKKTPNDWVALAHDYSIIDRDDDIQELIKRVGTKHLLITRNWYRPQKI